MSYFKLFCEQMVREGLLCRRQLYGLMTATFLFFMILFFFPLILPFSTQLLRTIYPGLFWIAILFALLLASERWFQQEYDEGMIDQWLVSGFPLTIWVLAKGLIYWAFITFPFLLTLPLLAMLYALTGYELFISGVSMLVGVPAILFLCGLVQAFNIGVNQRGLLIGIILLPLTIPILMIGSAAITFGLEGQNVIGFLALLLALSILATLLLPFATATALKS